MVPVNSDAELRRLMRLCVSRLEVNPGDPDALFVKSAILAKLGMYPAALHCLHRVADRREAYPGMPQFRSRLLAEMEAE